MLRIKGALRLGSMAAVLAVGACKDMPQARTEAEITDIARDATRDQFANEDSRLEDLETKISQLEKDKAGLQYTIDDQAAAIDKLSRQVDDLETETESIRAKVGY